MSSSRSRGNTRRRLRADLSRRIRHLIHVRGTSGNTGKLSERQEITLNASQQAQFVQAVSSAVQWLREAPRFPTPPPKPYNPGVEQRLDLAFKELNHAVDELNQLREKYCGDAPHD